MIRTLRLVAMMLRPPLAVVLMLFAAIGTALAGAPNALQPLLTALVPIAGWFVHATVLNDLADEQIDRINLVHAQGRPLVSGAAGRRQLLTIGLVAGTLALVSASLAGSRVAIVIAAGLALNVVYSLPPLRLSHRGVIAIALLPLGYVVVPFLVGFFSVGASPEPNDLVILCGLYIAFMGRIVLKDFRDIIGDAQFGKRTFLLRYGRENTCLLSAACWLAGSTALIAVAPPRASLTVVFAAYLLCVFHGLFLLARLDDGPAEQVVIGAIALVGRAMGISLLAHFSMPAEAWSFIDRALMHFAIGGFFVYLYARMAAQRSSVPAAAIRPY